MVTMKQFILQVREKYNITSDYQLAQLLGLTRQAISVHKSGKVKNFSEETAFRISQLLNLDPAYVLSCLAAERTEHKAIKTSWQKISRLLETYSGRAAIIVLCLLPLAMDANHILANANFSTVYIMSNSIFVLILVLVFNQLLIKREVKY